MTAEKLTLGPYTITPFHDTGFWVCKENGEGMEVSNIALIALIEKFWKENF